MPDLVNENGIFYHNNRRSRVIQQTLQIQTVKLENTLAPIVFSCPCPSNFYLLSSLQKHWNSKKLDSSKTWSHFKLQSFLLNINKLPGSRICAARQRELQMLEAGDNQLWLNFANKFLISYVEDSSWVLRILWTDEAHFMSTGIVNSKNCVH